jgi:hypothetical protein
MNLRSLLPNKILCGTAAILALSACTSMQTAPSGTPSAPVGPPKAVLYIGNSFMYYNNSLHTLVLNLARGATDKAKTAHRATSITISGSGMDWHDVGSYFRPDAVGRYSFIENNAVRFNPPGKIFDAAILMDCSQCPVHPTLAPVFFDYAKKHSDTVRANGAKPYFLMTWAYADAPAMTKGLADAYTEAGRQNKAVVIPAGLAFARSIARKPELNLYVADLRHPSMAGSYLTAAVVMATLYGVSPVGNPYTAGLDPAIARHLQEVAWETVQTYRQPAAQ